MLQEMVPIQPGWATSTPATRSRRGNSPSATNAASAPGLRLSKLPHHKTLDDYDFSFQPDFDPRKIRDLATLAFVQARANVALLGPPGVGKTHISVALPAVACRAGFTVYFTTLDEPPSSAARSARRSAAAAGDTG